MQVLAIGSVVAANCIAADRLHTAVLTLAGVV
jgi:thiamine biosynthesis lipoprotein ApbE